MNSLPMRSNMARYRRRADGSHISWTVDQLPNAGGLKLDWRECDGPLVTAPKQKGFGHVVIKSMIEQAVRGKVELNFAKEGLHWSLQAPGSIFLDKH